MLNCYIIKPDKLTIEYVESILVDEQKINN